MIKKVPKEVIDFAHNITLKKPFLDLVPNTDEYPWFIQELQNQFRQMERRKELLLPNLMDNNETIGIFSDYGGEHKGSHYRTYSFLICAWNQTAFFNDSMTKLREKFGLNEPLKEIAFKDFNYGPVKRSLSSYLNNLSNLLNGFLLNVVVDKTIPTFFGTDKVSTHSSIVKILADNNFGEWKPEVAEKLLRISHFISYLTAILSKENQKVCWMTDHDSIAAKTDLHEASLKIFSNLLSHYCKHKLSTIGGAVPFQEKSPLFMDLLSAPDIVAGSLEHYFSRSHGTEEEPQIKEEVNQVLCWLTGQGVCLKRHSIIIRPNSNGAINLGSLKFTLKDKNPEMTIIPIQI